MHNRIYPLSLLIFVFSSLEAQYFELGLFGGVSGYNGDLSPNTIQFNELHPAGGIDAGIPLNSHLGVKVAFRKGTISGNDENSSKPAFLARNLNFYSQIAEAGVRFEYFITGFDPLGTKVFSPYMTAGLSAFHFNPLTEYNGVTYELQPLGTEGQGMAAFPDRKPYQLTQLSIPLGVGVKYAITKRLNIAMECVANKTFTDYLDDVSTTYVDPNSLILENGLMSFELSNRTDESLNGEPLLYDENDQRGNPGYKDWFGYCGITLSYNFIFEKFSHPESYGIGCPDFNR